MTLKGKLVQVLPLQTGEGKNGQWRKQDVIIETEGQYPKKVCIAIWGDRINEQQLQVGTELEFSYDIESREYNGRWYTDVKAWKVDTLGAGGSSQQQPTSGNYSQPTAPAAPQVNANTEVQDDLPF